MSSMSGLTYIDRILMSYCVLILFRAFFSLFVCAPSFMDVILHRKNMFLKIKFNIKIVNDLLGLNSIRKTVHSQCHV